MPGRQSLPSTLKRSDKKAQDTWIKTYDSALEQYGEGERAQRTAYASLKHSYEKIGDHWEPKDHKGPSDPQSEQSGSAARNHPKPTYGGVDETGHTKDELLELARKTDAKVSSSMTKSELAQAINKANQRATAQARGK